MTGTPLSPDDRLFDLLAQRATQGLSPAEAEELERLLAAAGGDLAPSLDEAAAAYDLALQQFPLPPLPSALADRIAAEAARHLPPGENMPPPAPAAAQVEPSTPAAAPGWALRDLGWLAAAASLLAWLALGAANYLAPGQKVDFARQRQALLASASDALTLAWTPGTDATGVQATGDIVWSNAQQKGYMRIRGLAPNDPRREQYQLWIFDAERDERFPVDGGVFDVAEAGEVIVPIDARLPIARPVLFAVTVERPGGVVVSTRARIPLLAKPG